MRYSIINKGDLVITAAVVMVHAVNGMQSCPTCW